MLGTQPDICYTVTTMARFSANPTEDHLEKALYICRYLVGTQEYTLFLDGSKDMGLIAFTDSDWGQDQSDRRSITGFMIKFADCAINWYSHAQKTVALSSTEAEYMALSDCARQVTWVQSLLSELGVIIRPIPICADNQGSIFLAQNPVQERRSKHIDIKYHHVRECIEDGRVSLCFLEGTRNPADMFTKNLGRVPFYKCLEHLGLVFDSPYRKVPNNKAIQFKGMR